MSLREIVAAWAQANCPRSDVRASLLESLDRASPKCMTCTFTIGRLLTRTGRPFLVSCFGQELFAFELTSEQIARLEVEDEMLVCAETIHVQTHRQAADPVVTIESVTVDNDQALNRAEPITGTVRYRSRHMLLKPLALRVAMEHPSFGSLTMYHYLYDLFPTQGQFSFRFGALGEIPRTEAMPLPRVVPFFFQLWTTKPIDAPPSGAPTGHGFPPRPQPPAFPPWMPKGMIPRSLPWAQPKLPLSSSFPPAYDPGPMAAFPDSDEVPVSDIRAVLVQID